MHNMFGEASERYLLWVLSLFIVVSVSCAKADRKATTPGYVLVDDMEGTDGRIKWSPSNGWPPGQGPGIWTSSTDCLQQDRILPEPYFFNPSGWSYDTLPHSYETMSGITSTRAAHLRTRFNDPLQDVWGANIGFDFVEQSGVDAGAPRPSASGGDAGTSLDGQPCRQGSSWDFNGAPVDLRVYSYSGLTFWAMASPAGRQAIRVQINDWNTDPRAGQCNSGSPSDESNCYNAYGKDIMLTSTLTQYRVAFSELRQDPSWGYAPNLLAFDLTRVFSVNFEVPLPGCVKDTKANCAGDPAPVSFDVWIDDLYFVKGE